MSEPWITEPLGDGVCDIRGAFSRRCIAEYVLADHARLIAAAPELLEALRELIVLDDTHPHDGSAYDRAYAAIAKATGEQ
jgi:hypothetical protein